MSSRSKAVIAWSSGKDCAYSLHMVKQKDRVKQKDSVEIVGSLTTLSEEFRRVSMHGVRDELLDLQLESVGLPATKVWIPSPCPNDVYESRMSVALDELRAAGVSHVVFGDLFLQDVREYREAQLRKVGMEAIFPLWKRNTAALAREMIGSGLKATLTCVDSKALDPRFAGRAFDEALLGELPASVDPCGENGEFHTVVHGGPMFERTLAVEVGEVLERDGFVFADVRPASAS